MRPQNRAARHDRTAVSGVHVPAGPGGARELRCRGGAPDRRGRRFRPEICARPSGDSARRCGTPLSSSRRKRRSATSRWRAATRAPPSITSRARWPGSRRTCRLSSAAAMRSSRRDEEKRPSPASKRPSTPTRRSTKSGTGSTRCDSRRSRTRLRRRGAKPKADAWMPRAIGTRKRSRPRPRARSFTGSWR